MTQTDRDRILQLIAYVKIAYHAAMKSYARIDVSLVEAFKLCNSVIASLDQPRREYYCRCCADFSPAEESGPDLVCTRCRLVLITFREIPAGACQDDKAML